jgi:hypothetical protein
MQILDKVEAEMGFNEPESAPRKSFWNYPEAFLIL